MNIYKVTRHDDSDFDEYESFVCYAENESDARNTNPDDEYISIPWATYADINNLIVELIGEGIEGSEKGIILAQYKNS